MTRRKLIPLTSYDEVPANMTEAEARDFWQTHEITEEYLASAPPVSDDHLPPVRPDRKPFCAQLPAPVVRRLKRLAWQRGIDADALLQDIVEQGLAAEEERLRATGS